MRFVRGFKWVNRSKSGEGVREVPSWPDIVVKSYNDKGSISSCLPLLHGFNESSLMLYFQWAYPGLSLFQTKCIEPSIWFRFFLQHLFCRNLCAFAWRKITNIRYAETLSLAPSLFLCCGKRPQKHPCGLQSPARLIISDIPTLYLTWEVWSGLWVLIKISERTKTSHQSCWNGDLIFLIWSFLREGIQLQLEESEICNDLTFRIQNEHSLSTYSK